MPIDPRSELPVRIAKAVSDILGVKINPSNFYTHDDDTPVGTWRSSVQKRYDYERDTQELPLFHNRRVTCFDLIHDTSKTPAGAIPLKTDFNGKEGMHVFARCAIHEVHDSPNHDFNGQNNPVFDPSDQEWAKKVGVELTLDTTSPIQERTLPNGNFAVFFNSTGQASTFASGVAQYDPREHGTRLVNFASGYISENWTPRVQEQTLG